MPDGAEGDPTYRPDMTESTTPSVLIAGGGVAALETLIALRDLAGDRVTVAAPGARDRLHVPPDDGRPAVLSGARPRVRARRIAEEFRADFIQDSVAEVRADEKIVRCASGRDVAYDHLIVAVGARRLRAIRTRSPSATTRPRSVCTACWPTSRQGYLQRVAFVVPGEAAWTLPLYELALMTARAGLEHGHGRRPASRS